jgi:hypothetical protein
MATWKKVIVSGSAAELSQLNVGANQQINTSPSSTFLSGSFSGSFFGDGSGLSGVAASFPITAKTDLATTDKFFINDGASKFVTYGNLVTDLAGAGAGTSNLTTGDTGDSLALTAQIAVTGVTASFTGNLTGTASFATSASQAVSAISASQAVSAISASQAVSASFATNASQLNGQAASFYQNASNINAGTLGNAFLPTAINVTSVTASFAGNLTGTASFATSASQAITATNATNTAVTDTTTGTGPYYVTFVDGTTGNRAQLVDSTGLTYNATTNTLTVTSSFATAATSASYAASVNNLTNAVTNNADNRILTATGGGTINGENNLTFDGTTLSVTGNATLTGNLTVAGTASFTNTDNLNIRDKFILINSGSATLSDSGWITQYNAAGSGSAFYLDAGTGADHGPYGRFAVAFDTLGTTTSPTVSEYVVTAKINQASNPTNAVPPTWGTGSNGSGNMWITNAGDIFIYG